MTLPGKAGIYVRISQDRSGDALGVQRQVEDCERLAASRGWTVSRRYIENDVSASTQKSRKPKPRPEYLSMRADAEAGVIDGIIVYNMDRLTRRMTELTEFLPWREQLGIPFMTTEGDDTESASGVMVIQIKGAVAQQEAARISERVLRARRQERERGLYMASGHRAFGWTDSTLREHQPREAAAIRQGVSLVLAGGAPGAVMKQWQEQGLATVTNSRWHLNTVKHILRSPKLAGLMPYEGTFKQSVNVRPIIEVEQWMRMQLILDARGSKREPGYGARVHLLSGFVFCASCGSRMVPQVAPSRSRWACITSVGGCGRMFRNFRDVNRIVEAVVQEALSVVGEGDSKDDCSMAIALLQSDIAALEAEITDARRRWMAKQMEREDYYATVADLRAVINDSKARQSALQVIPVAVDQSALEVWSDTSVENLAARRALLSNIITKVMVKPVGKIGRRPVPLDSVDVLLR